jgi:hypothetical protein
MADKKRRAQPHRDPTAPEADALDQDRPWDEDDRSEPSRSHDVDVPVDDALDQERDAQLDDEEHE